MKTLAIFDFDDTLFRNDAKIVVIKSINEIYHLSTKEYASYVPHEDDQFDFSQFDTYPANPVPIVSVVSLLREHVNEFGLENVIILTARRVKEPVEQILNNFYLPNVKVIALGSSHHKVKADYAKSLIEESGYQKIIFYEDNISYIHEMKSLLGPILGEEFFSGFRIIIEEDQVQILNV